MALEQYSTAAQLLPTPHFMRGYSHLALKGRYAGLVK